MPSSRPSSRAIARSARLFAAALVASLGAACSDDTDTGSNAPVADSRTYQWRLATTWPAQFPVFHDGVARFASDVEAMSGGRMQVEIFGGGELIPPLQVFDAVSLGGVQMGHGSAYYWAGKVPAAQFLSTVPFGLTAPGMNAWLYASDGQEIWTQLYEPFNLKPLPMGITGFQMGGWFNRRVNTVDDLKGLKMRIPGLGGKVFAAAGGNPVLLSGAELYTSLERGVIDAVEWVGPFHDQRLGLDRAARYYYYPGWHEPGTALELIVNLDAWRALPPDLRRIIETAAAATHVWMNAQFELKNAEALAELRAKGKTEILRFPVQVLRELESRTDATLDAEAEADPEFARVLKRYRELASALEDWRRVSISSYHDAPD